MPLSPSVETKERDMQKPKKSVHDRALDAEHRASAYLADANEAAERGNVEKAEKLYAKSQYWLDRMNVLNGDGDRPAPKH
jgi:hypothetical protein